MSKLSLIDWVHAFDRGDFWNPSREVQCKAGWYDWFCRDSSLFNKTVKLAPKVKKIAKSPLIDSHKVYVFFKNNCPMRGSLYDDFRICDIESGDVLFTVVPSNGHKSSEGSAEVWGKLNDFKEPLVLGKWKDVLNFFRV
jgi:hypothetical protein